MSHPAPSGGDGSSSSETEGESIPSRRQILSAVGAAGIGGIAGCTGGGGGTPTQTAGGGTQTATEKGTPTPWEDFDKPFISDTWTVPTEMEWNAYNPTSGRQGELVYHRFMQYNRHADVNDPQSTLLSDWSVEGKSATLKLVENHKWHDGNKVTAQDVAIKLKLEKLFQAPVDDYVKSVSKGGDYTVNLDLRGTTSPGVFEWTLMGLPLDTPAKQFKKFADQYADVTTEKARKNLQKKVSDFAIKEPIGNAPGKWESASKSELTLSVHGGHPMADTINWNGWVYKYLPTNQKTWQALKAREIDGMTHFMSPNVMRGLPEEIDVWLLTEWVGQALSVNHRRKPFDNRKFRQAMAHVVKSKAIANAVGGGKIKRAADAGGARIKMPRKYFTGTSSSNHKEFLTPIEDQLTVYGQGNTEKAASLLKEAGFTKQKGQWMMPNGEPVKFTIKTDSCCNDWVDGARTAAGHLSQFGIKAQFTTMEGAALWSDFSEGNFDVIGANWGAYGKRHAYFDYHNEFDPDGRPASTGFDPTKVEVSSLPNREGGTLNLTEMKATLAKTADPKKTKALIQDLAAAYNEIQPQIMLMEKNNPGFMDDMGWEYPNVNDPANYIQDEMQWLPKIGELKAEKE